MRGIIILVAFIFLFPYYATAMCDEYRGDKRYKEVVLPESEYVLDRTKSVVDFEREVKLQNRREAMEKVGSSLISGTIAHELRTSRSKDYLISFGMSSIVCDGSTGYWLPSRLSKPEGSIYRYTGRYIIDREKFSKEVERISKELGEKVKEEIYPVKTVPFHWGRGLKEMVFGDWENNEPAQIWTIFFVAGSGTGYFLFDQKYKENWSKYENSQNSSDRRRYYDEASQAHTYKQAFLIVGITSWAANVIHSFIDDNRHWGETTSTIYPLSSRKEIGSLPITMNVIPLSDGGAIVLSYSF